VSKEETPTPADLMLGLQEETMNDRFDPGGARWM
jgi:hypothetical protein